MNRFTVLTACLAYAVALLTGTFERYLAALDRLGDGDTPAIFELPYTGLAVTIITVIASILAAAAAYLIVRDITSSSMNGAFAAITAWIVRGSLSRWFAEKLFSLKHETPLSVRSTW